MQRFSYTSTPKCQPHRYCSIVDLARTRATKHPNQEIFIHRRPNGERLSITNETLEKKSTSLANYLYSMGVKRTQYVSIVGPNSLEWLVGELAILKIGAVAVHLSIGGRDAHDAMEIIKSTNCRYILMDPGVDMTMKSSLSTLLTGMEEWNELHPDNSSQPILLRFCEGFESSPCLDEILKNTIDVELPVIYPEDTAVVFTTSGSTGQPKLVKMSHIAIVNFMSDVLDEDDPLIFNDRPFGWLGGTPIPCIVLGVPRLFTDCNMIFKGDYARYVWEAIKEEQCVSASLLPFIISDICEYKVQTPEDSFQLKTIITGGETIGEICKQVLGTVCSEVQNLYASTEMGPVTMKTFALNTLFIRGDVGRCLPGIEVKIVDRNGDVTLLGSQGEICVKSSIMSQGYLNAPERNKELFFEGGWMRSGDIGKLSEDGNLIIVGKMKAVISRGTRTLIPGMIEDVIRGISGVKEVAVIPVPDKRLHEEVCVCYIAETDSDIDEQKIKLLSQDLFLRSETADGLGDAPTYFVKLTEFPALSNGKVDKQKLRIIAISNLGLS